MQNPPLPIKHYSVLGSTNDEAKRLALAGEQGPLWIHADRQTRGRGRRSRQWQSPPGNLAATGLYYWDGPLAQSAQLGFVAALAVIETASQWVQQPQALAIKWPNDILLGDAKLAGILLESGQSAHGGHWIAVGIGLNIEDAPKDLPYPATALRNHLHGAAQSPKSGEVLDEVIARFESWHARLQKEGFAPVRLGWLSRAYGLGKPIKTSTGQVGVFEDLSAEGALLLRMNTGRSIEISAGEVFFS